MANLDFRDEFCDIAGMLIGYARVSTPDQNLDQQITALQAAGCTHIYKEVASGALAARPQLDETLRFIRKGDVLVAWSLDRVGRNLRHLLELVEDMRKRDVGLRTLKEGIDLSTAAGKLFLSVLGSIAEFERERNLERTHAGLAAAKAQGRRGGRPQKLSTAQLAMAEASLSQGTLGVAELSRELGVHRSTLHRRRKHQDSAREAAKDAAQ